MAPSSPLPDDHLPLKKRGRLPLIGVGLSLLGVGWFFVAVLWPVLDNIPHAADVDKINQFHESLELALGKHALKGLDENLKVKPRSCGRGDIILWNHARYSKEDIEMVRLEFNRLNTSGNYVLTLTGP